MREHGGDQRLASVRHKTEDQADQLAKGRESYSKLRAENKRLRDASKLIGKSDEEFQEILSVKTNSIAGTLLTVREGLDPSKLSKHQKSQLKAFYQGVLTLLEEEAQEAATLLKN